MVKKRGEKLWCFFILLSLYISAKSTATVPEQYCTIISTDEKTEPVIKFDSKNKKWAFSLRLETRDCNELEFTIDIYYETPGNSVLGQDYATTFKIVNNQIKVDFNFSGEDNFVFPSDNYYYRIEINPELQNPSILERRKLKPIIFDKKFAIGNPEEKERYFMEHIEKFTNLTNLANILFQKAAQPYFEKFMEIKSKFEKGACEKFRRQKAKIAEGILRKQMHSSGVSDDSDDTSDKIDENERKCEIWQNTLDANWISFENISEYTASSEENTEAKGEINEKVDKIIEIDDTILNILNSLNIIPNIPKDTKTVEWIILYNNAKQSINELYSRKIVFLPHILDKISELYDKLRFFTICLKDILKDGSRRDLKDWGNCPEDLKGDNLLSRKDELVGTFTTAYHNILQRIYEAKYPEDIQKLRKDLGESIENIYNFFTQIQAIIKTHKSVPPATAKNIEENYNIVKKYLNDLKSDYKKGPVNAVYAEAYRQMNNEILDNQEKLLDNFIATFNSFLSNVKEFKGFPATTKNYIKAVSDSLASIALHLKDSELNSILKKSWARIVPEYEVEKIEKVVIPNKSQHELIFEKAQELVKEHACIFKFEEDPKNPKVQKRVDIDILFSQLKSLYSDNIKTVNDFLLKQPYFNKVEDNTYLCSRRLTFLWIKEIIHDDSFDSLLADYLQKYSEAIIKISPPLNITQYSQLDSLVIDVAQIYDILTTKLNRGLLLQQTMYDLKNPTSKLLSEINSILSKLYTTIENELKPLFENADDSEKLNAISNMYTTKISIEIKDENNNVTKRENIFVPYLALLIKAASYISATQDSDYIKTILPYFDAKYIDNERREIIKATLEKIGIEKFIPLQQFNDNYIQALQSANKDISNVQEKIEQLADKIIKNAEKVNKEAAKTFAKALELAPESDRKAYETLEKESTKIQLKNSIFCNICDNLKEIRIKVEEKLNK